MPGQVRGPLVIDPWTLQGLCRDHQGHGPAVVQLSAEPERPVLAGLQLALVEEGAQAQLDELVAERAHPRLIGRAVREEHIVGRFLNELHTEFQ